MPKTLRALLALSFVSLLAAPATAQEWTRFRGPNGTGISDATTIPVEWSPADYNFKIDLPGIGHGSPVVWGEKVFLMSADPKDATRYLLCYHATTGKQLWKRTYKSSKHRLHPRSSYASCTPAVDAQRVYFAWARPERTTLLALDHDGQDVWERDLGKFQSMHGFGTSPMLYKNMLILSNMQQSESFKAAGETAGESSVIALDRATGKDIWKTLRTSTVAAYSVPTIYQPEGGKPELISCSSGNNIFSLDPMTGEENWAIKVFTMRTVASPIVAGGLIFGSTGSGGGGNFIVAVRPGKNPKVVYKYESASEFKAPYVPTPVTDGDLVFLIYDMGYMSCLNAPDGKFHWKRRTGGAFSGSPVRVRDKIYCIDEDGVVWVIAAAKQYKLLAKNDLGDPSRSTPAISGGRMFLRTYHHLISVGGK